LARRIEDHRQLIRELAMRLRESLEAVAAIMSSADRSKKKDKSRIDIYNRAPRLDMMMEAARSLLRHHARVELNPIPALAWRAIGVRLWPAPHTWRGEAQTLVRDRASDARARADALRGGDRLRKAA
jgi:hypothetical protein